MTNLHHVGTTKGIIRFGFSKIRELIEVGIFSGVVSEKSDGHIACLVHKIFNVTIPLPISTFEPWPGESVQVGEEITFTVDHLELDVHGQLPYIRGSL